MKSDHPHPCGRAMYADEELEAWGELYCKLELHARGALPFERFMALPVAARRRCCLWAALNPSRDLRATPAGGVSEQITPAAGAGVSFHRPGDPASFAATGLLPSGRIQDFLSIITLKTQ